MSSSTSLITDPNTAKRQQLWHSLQGHHRIIRYIYHDQLIDNETFTHFEMIRPSHGESTITLRAPTHPEYQSEMLQNSTIQLETRTHKSAPRTEQRVFRLRNGEWSVWDTNGEGNVTVKLADLALAGGMPEPEFGNPGKDPVVAEKLVTVRRWVDGEGRGNELELRWFSKGDFNWSMQHVIGKSDGERVTLQADGYIHLQGGALFEFLHKGVGRKSGFWK